MKRFFAFVLPALLCLAAARAGDLKVEAVMAADKDSEPTDTFEPDVPKVCAFFKTEGSHKGDKLRAVWIAEDVGDAAEPNSKIDEASYTGKKNNFFGMFSLSKPTDGWPEGTYRVDFYSGDEVVTSVKFTIKQGAKPDEADKKESSADE